MKRILILSSNISIFGGTERVTVNLANNLCQNYDVHIITLFQTSNIPFKLKNNVKIYNLYIQNKRLREHFISSFFKIRKYVLEQDIDIVLVIGRTVTIVSLLFKIFLKVKIIFCEHNTIMSENYTRKTIKRTCYSKIFQFLINRLSERIILLSEKEKENYQYKNKINNKKMKVIYNFINLDNINTNKTYNWSVQKIITVGRIDYQKGYEYLIEVAKLVFAKYPVWQWHIYGDGEAEYKSKIIDLIEQNNLQNNIILQGNHSNIYDLYQNYSFYVMTSRYEGLPMVLLEAKAKELPIVSFDINSGPSDIVRDGVDGFLVKPFDCQNMADKICELIENPELRQKFSDNAHGNIDKFSKEKIIKQWCDLIDSLS
mgnify:CR=1 FL=1